MFGHDNFPAVQAAWQQFWNKTNERPLVAITIPKPGVVPADKPAYLEAFFGNYEPVADKVARWYETHEFYGESIPFYAMDFGPDHMTGLWGQKLVLGETRDTSWVVHLDKALNEVEIRFDPNSECWEHTVLYYEALKRKLGENVMIAAPTPSAGLDSLVALRSNIHLLTDLYDMPEVVKNASDRVNLALADAVAAFSKLFEYEKYGSITRHGMYANGPTSVLQCDFSCMISPEMFEEFAVPSIEFETTLFDAMEYHLDGPDALRHLERLTKIPKIGVIQWVAGAGEAASMDWTSLYQRIVSLGKGLILGGRPENVRRLINLLPTPTLFFHVSGISSRAEAEDFIASLEK